MTAVAIVRSQVEVICKVRQCHDVQIPVRQHTYRQLDTNLTRSGTNVPCKLCGCAAAHVAKKRRAVVLNVICVIYI